jgi:hypothetical protein
MISDRMSAASVRYALRPAFSLNSALTLWLSLYE